MTKNKVVFIFFMLFAGLCCSLSSSGQTPVQDQFETFNQVYKPERLYLHTDKDAYLAGEIVWFKVYSLLDTIKSKHLISQVAYVEIMDRDSKRVVQGKIPMTNRGGQGSFYLPLTLKTDRYILRAYTNWMRNFGSNSYFEKPISITNTVSIQAATATRVDSISVRAEFFPEGGQLLQGFESRMAFRVTDNFGKGLDISGTIVDDFGDTVTKIAATRFGLGNFTFVPASGRKYMAIFRTADGRTVARGLPVAMDQGYLLSVMDNKDGRYKVRIQGNTKQNRGGEDMLLFIHANNTTRLAQKEDLRYGIETIMYVDKSKLAPGMNFFTLFNKQQQPVAERLVFVRPATTASVIRLTTNKESYSTRENVDVTMTFAGQSTMVDSNNCSISVYELDSIQGISPYTLVNYRSLFQELKGEIESPEYYLSSDAGVDEAIENLMMTHGWRRFHWENIQAANPASVLKYLPEYNGQLVTARVTSVKTGKPAVGVLAFLSVPSIPYGFYTGNTDASGLVQFEVRHFFGPNEALAKARMDSGGPYRVDILTPFTDEPGNGSIARLSYSRASADLLVNKSIAMQSQNVYRADSLRKFVAPSVTDTLPFFGKAEFRYMLDDYKRFTTMEEVLREYVFPVTVQAKGGKLHMVINNELTREGYENNILVLIDGVPLSDYNKIFAYDPLKVRKLEVVTKRYLYGPVVFNGIASFETYKGKFDAFDLDPGTVTIDYEGLQLHREFYSPDYASGAQSKRIPDMRTTLQWVPQLITAARGTANVKFYTSDMKGKFVVVVEGMAADGTPLSSSKTFTVE